MDGAGGIPPPIHIPMPSPPSLTASSGQSQQHRQTIEAETKEPRSGEHNHMTAWTRMPFPYTMYLSWTMEFQWTGALKLSPDWMDLFLQQDTPSIPTALPKHRIDSCIQQFCSASPLSPVRATHDVSKHAIENARKWATWLGLCTGLGWQSQNALHAEDIKYMNAAYDRLSAMMHGYWTSDAPSSLQQTRQCRPFLPLMANVVLAWIQCARTSMQERFGSVTWEWCRNWEAVATSGELTGNSLRYHEIMQLRELAEVQHLGWEDIVLDERIYRFALFLAWMALEEFAAQGQHGSSEDIAIYDIDRLTNAPLQWSPHSARLFSSDYKAFSYETLGSPRRLWALAMTMIEQLQILTTDYMLQHQGRWPPGLPSDDKFKQYSNRIHVLLHGVGSVSPSIGGGGGLLLMIQDVLSRMVPRRPEDASPFYLKQVLPLVTTTLTASFRLASFPRLRLNFFRLLCPEVFHRPGYFERAAHHMPPITPLTDEQKHARGGASESAEGKESHEETILAMINRPTVRYDMLFWRIPWVYDELMRCFRLPIAPILIPLAMGMEMSQISSSPTRSEMDGQIHDGGWQPSVFYRNERLDSVHFSTQSLIETIHRPNKHSRQAAQTVGTPMDRRIRQQLSLEVKCPNRTSPLDSSGQRLQDNDNENDDLWSNTGWPASLQFRSMTHMYEDIEYAASPMTRLTANEIRRQWMPNQNLAFIARQRLNLLIDVLIRRSADQFWSVFTRDIQLLSLLCGMSLPMRGVMLEISTPIVEIKAIEPHQWPEPLRHHLADVHNGDWNAAQSGWKDLVGALERTQSDEGSMCILSASTHRSHARLSERVNYERPEWRWQPQLVESKEGQVIPKLLVCRYLSFQSWPCGTTLTRHHLVTREQVDRFDRQMARLESIQTEMCTAAAKFLPQWTLYGMKISPDKKNEIKEIKRIAIEKKEDKAKPEKSIEKKLITAKTTEKKLVTAKTEAKKIEPPPAKKARTAVKPQKKESSSSDESESDDGDDSSDDSDRSVSPKKTPLKKKSDSSASSASSSSSSDEEDEDGDVKMKESVKKVVTKDRITEDPLLIKAFSLVPALIRGRFPPLQKSEDRRIIPSTTYIVASTVSSRMKPVGSTAWWLSDAESARNRQERQPQLDAVQKHQSNWQSCNSHIQGCGAIRGTDAPQRHIPMFDPAIDSVPPSWCVSIRSLLGMVSKTSSDDDDDPYTNPLCDYDWKLSLQPIVEPTANSNRHAAYWKSIHIPRPATDGKTFLSGWDSLDLLSQANLTVPFQMNCRRSLLYNPQCIPELASAIIHEYRFRPNFRLSVWNCTHLMAISAYAMTSPDVRLQNLDMGIRELLYHFTSPSGGQTRTPSDSRLWPSSYGLLSAYWRYTIHSQQLPKLGSTHIGTADVQWCSAVERQDEHPIHGKIMWMKKFETESPPLFDEPQPMDVDEKVKSLHNSVLSSEIIASDRSHWFDIHPLTRRPILFEKLDWLILCLALVVHPILHAPTRSPMASSSSTSPVTPVTPTTTPSRTEHHPYSRMMDLLAFAEEKSSIPWQQKFRNELKDRQAKLAALRATTANASAPDSEHLYGFELTSLVDCLQTTFSVKRSSTCVQEIINRMIACGLPLDEDMSLFMKPISTKKNTTKELGDYVRSALNEFFMTDIQQRGNSIEWFNAASTHIIRLPTRTENKGGSPTSTDGRTWSYSSIETAVSPQQKTYYLFWVTFLSQLIENGVSPKPATQAAKRQQRDVSHLHHLPTDIFLAGNPKKPPVLRMARRTRGSTEIQKQPGTETSLSAQSVAQLTSVFATLYHHVGLLRDFYRHPSLVWLEGICTQDDTPDLRQWLRDRGLHRLIMSCRRKRDVLTSPDILPFTARHVQISRSFDSIWFGPSNNTLRTINNPFDYATGDEETVEQEETDRWVEEVRHQKSTLWDSRRVDTKQEDWLAIKTILTESKKTESKKTSGGNGKRGSEKETKKESKKEGKKEGKKMDEKGGNTTRGTKRKMTPTVIPPSSMVVAHAPSTIPIPNLFPPPPSRPPPARLPPPGVVLPTTWQTFDEDDEASSIAVVNGAFSIASLRSKTYPAM